MVNVTLREKKLKKDRISLYLDFYPYVPNPKTGKTTRREFLGLYIIGKPRNEVDKEQNKETRLTAEKVLAKRKLQLANEEYGFVDKEKRKGDFVQYFKMLGEKRKGSSADNWSSALLHLEAFTGGSIRFKDITEQWCCDFRDYLLNATSRRSAKTKLATNSAVSYFTKLKAALKEAFKRGFITEDLGRIVDSIKSEETQRQYFTHEELQQLVHAECTNEVLKKAGLFSAMTGLRFSDIQKLVWSEIQLSNDGYEIRFRQKKTKQAQTLPLSDTANRLLGERGLRSDHIFKGLKYSAYNNKLLREWISNAGITKHCTFHSFRHSNATLLLSQGVDLYVISKLLGHKDIATTSLYTKVVDQKKREAANKIELAL
jgi:integrase